MANGKQLPAAKHSSQPVVAVGRSLKPASVSRKSQQHQASLENLHSPQVNLGRRGLLVAANSSLSASSASSASRAGQPMGASSTASSLASGSSSSASAGSELSGASFSSAELAYAKQRQAARSSPQQQASPTHLNAPSEVGVSAAGPKVPGAAGSDNLRYEYDDHYFLTDPDEFIHEFFPHSSEWQLIKPRAITLAEFEQLPFVRSLFFRYGLYFPQAHIRSVLQADSSGATTIKIGMPTHLIPNLIFHYNLRYYDSEEEYFEGISLKRFVMQSIENG